MVYPHSAAVLREARLKTVAEYIAKRRQTVHRTIVDRPILEECRGRRGSVGAQSAFNGGSRTSGRRCR